MTVVEINLAAQGMVDGAVLGTQEMLPFMQSLELVHPYQIEGSGWEKGMYCFIKGEEVIKAYFTPERIETFVNLLKTRNADVLIVFHEKQFVVRLETVDPMQDAEKIDKIVARTIGLMDKLRITPEERARLKALAPAV
jgi:hypothetical protein